MLLLQFAQYSSFFLGTPKSDIPGAALELCQLKTKQFSPEILKLNTKHKDNPFTLNCFLVHCTFLFIFHAGSREIFGSQVIKKKRPVRLVFPDYLSVCYDYDYIAQKFHLKVLQIFYRNEFTTIWKFWSLVKCTANKHEKLK